MNHQRLCLKQYLMDVRRIKDATVTCCRLPKWLQTLTRLLHGSAGSDEVVQCSDSESKEELVKPRVVIRRRLLVKRSSTCSTGTIASSEEGPVHKGKHTCSAKEGPFVPVHFVFCSALAFCYLCDVSGIIVPKQENDCVHVHGFVPKQENFLVADDVAVTVPVHDDFAA